jgi:hypothetical protein
MRFWKLHLPTLEKTAQRRLHNAKTCGQTIPLELPLKTKKALRFFGEGLILKILSKFDAALKLYYYGASFNCATVDYD